MKYQERGVRTATKIEAGAKKPTSKKAKAADNASNVTNPYPLPCMTHASFAAPLQLVHWINKEERRKRPSSHKSAHARPVGFKPCLRTPTCTLSPRCSINNHASNQAIACCVASKSRPSASGKAKNVKARPRPEAGCAQRASFHQMSAAQPL